MNKLNSFFLYIVVCLLLNSTVLQARDKDDLCSWLTADLLLKQNKWSYLATIEERINNNISSSQLFSIGMSARYQLTRQIRLSGAYEFFGNTHDGKVTPEHRLMIQGEYSFAINNWKFNNRLSILNDFENRHIYKWQLRDRFRISYQMQKLSPFAYTEVYTSANDFSLKLYKMRYAAGVTIDLNDKNSLSLYYLLEDYDTKPLHQHIIGINYSHTIQL